jgi:hypothetical protein
VKREPTAENGRSFLLTAGLLKSSVIKVAILNDLRAPSGMPLVNKTAFTVLYWVSRSQHSSGGVKMEHFTDQACLA